MKAALAAPVEPIKIPAHNAVVKRLGNWTTARKFEVRAHRGSAVLDLRSSQIPAGDIQVNVDLDHAMLKLLVPNGAMVDGWDLRRAGRGRVKDPEGPGSPEGRQIVVAGQLRDAEIRIRRGGIAILAAMCSREFLADARRARKQGGQPTVHDPAGHA